MKSEVKKNKNKKPLTLRSVKNALKTHTTLSDRLKQAGIKEIKPKCERKGSKNKTAKTKKNSFKMGYSEDFMNNQNPADKIKKYQKLLNNYATSYIKESFPNYDSCRENVSEDPKGFSKKLPESVQDKTTIFVSLDFIEDCQKYKRKIRKGNWHLKSQRKSTRNSYSKRGKYIDKSEGPRKLQVRTSSKHNKLSHYGNMEVNLAEEREGEDKKFYSISDNYLKNPNTDMAINDPIKDKGRKGLADSCQGGQPFFKRMSSDDIAKIDKKYLQSLLSCITGKEEKVASNESKQSDEILTQSLSGRKKKITGKDYFERKVKAKELQEVFSNTDDNINRLTEMQKECQEYTQRDIISARVVRDLTKSEEQIKLKKAKNFYNCNNSNVKNKNVAYSKPDINDNRKKRKARNKFMKNNVKEFIETSFPSEVSKMADIKELWRRETQKKSENSLTSYSSCTVPESEEFPGSKNLESYKVLKKLVGEEINNLANKSENKDNTRGIKTKNNTDLGSLRESEQVKNSRKSPLYDNSNDLGVNEKTIPKRWLMTAECGEYKTAYEDNMQKSQKLGILDEDTLKEVKPKMKRLEGKTKQAGKLPGQVIESWSILNRLEQAFLGLGTPTLQKNVKDSSAPKGKYHISNEKSNVGGQKLNTDRPKESKKEQKCKDSENAVSTNLKKYETASKIPKIIGTENKLSSLKEKHQANKSKKDGKQEPLHNNIIPTSKGDENSVMVIKKKRQTRPDASSAEKIQLKEVPRSTEKEKNEGQLKHDITSRAHICLKSKTQKLSKDQTSEMHLSNLNHIKISAENLERKKTFDVISVMDASVVQSPNSESCDVNDDNREKQLSHTKDKDSKSDDTGSKLPSNPRRLAKNPVNDTPPQVCQNPTYVGEKKCLKPSKLPKTRVNPENKNEKKPIMMEPAPQPTQPRAELNKNITNDNKDQLGKNSKSKINDSSNTNIDNIDDNKGNAMCKNTNINNTEKPLLVNDSNNTILERAVKKRSILSVHLNQTPRKFVKIREKDNSDCTLENTQNYINSVHKEFKTSYSNAYVKSTDPYDVVSDQNRQNHLTNKGSEFSITKTEKKSDILPRLTSSSVYSTVCYEEQDQDVEQGRGESTTSKTQPLWEQDISHYHTIVREIMSQYKRIDGFLKQTEHLNNFSNDSVSATTLSDDESNKSYKLFNNSQMLNIDEYRQKIISEYRELPIFEYKSKLRRSKNGNFCTLGGRKNLSVVKDYKTDADVDVKDYHPKIQKVLDSQLYVDTERPTKQDEPKVKFREKSLHEMLTCRNGKTLNGEVWKRTCSAPKALISQNSPLTLFGVRTLSSLDESLGSITSTSMTGYSEETESESFREITGK